MKKIIQMALILIMILSCSVAYAAKQSHYALGDIVSIGRYRDPNDAYSLAQAKTTIGSENKQLVINESITLYDDCNMPDNIAIKVTPNGLITATHADIIIHGPFEGPLSQCFALDANSSVTFRDGSIKEQCPLWYSSGGFTDTTLTAAITALGSAHWTLNISRGTWVIDANLTFAANTRLKFEEGTVFDIDANTTVTINGDIDAGLYQIFNVANATNSLVSFGTDAEKRLYPEWWGGAADGSTDNTDPINYALAAALAAGGGIVRLQEGTYDKSGALNIGTGVKLLGQGATTTYIQNTASNINGINIAASARYVEIRDLYLYAHIGGADSTSIGLSFDTTNGFGHCNFENIFITEYGYGVKGGNEFWTSTFNKIRVAYAAVDSFHVAGTNGSSLGCTFNNCYSLYAADDGFYFTIVYNFTLINCIFDGVAGQSEFINLYSGSEHTLINCHFETGYVDADTESLIYIGSGTVNMIGCRFHNTIACDPNTAPGEYGRLIDVASGDVTITGCREHGTTGNAYIIYGRNAAQVIESNNAWLDDDNFYVADAGSWIKGGDSVEDLTASGALNLYGATRINADDADVVGTLADASYEGQLKTIVLYSDANSYAGDGGTQVTIAHHETEDSEVAQFDAVDEYLLLLWTGTEWATVSNSCTFP